MHYTANNLKFDVIIWYVGKMKKARRCNIYGLFRHKAYQSDTKEMSAKSGRLPDAHILHVSDYQLFVKRTFHLLMGFLWGREISGSFLVNIFIINELRKI
ncbi:ubiquitin C-terminal hydrolase [Chitinophaga terrae (ex Kim and Jung 2007)]|nr:ubiquitin C-terminal hydrolase [Chitinophaga terrae (ex Kim and Jung 2007)]